MYTTSQIAEIFNSLKTALGFGSQRRQRRSQQITESLLVASPHTSTHLMQVTQSKVLRLIDNNRIGIRDINSTLNNGSGKQYIVIIIHKTEDNLFQLFGLHLSMTDTNTAIRNVTHDHCFQFCQVLYAIIHKEHLTVTAHFKVNRFGNDFFVKRMHLGLNRITVGRRSLDNRQVAGSHQRELKCSRNRCSRHGKGIYIHLNLTQFFFHTHSELLLLIHNQQAQVVKLHVLADNLMCTYQDIDRTCFQFLQDAGLRYSTLQGIPSKRLLKV